VNRFILERKYWALPVIVWTVVAAVSFLWNWSGLDRHIRELAGSQGRFVFKMVEAVRLWNARHGGVYAVVDSSTPPNLYLDVPERDIVSPSGRPLTLINPAYMTRQLADTVLEQSDMLVHITSLKPLNPGNAADPWEMEALRGFERGESERLDFVQKDAGTVARYMAPLRTMEACLKCHRKQGYKVGDIRGGISVSFPAGPLLKTVKAQRRNLILVHAAVWLLLTALTLFALSGLRRQMLSLKQAKEQQDALVDQRTAELRQEVREREEAEARLRLLINSSGEGIYGVDPDGNFTFCNPVALRLLGYREVSDVLGRNAHELVHRGLHGDGREAARCKLHLWREGIPAHGADDLFTRADGTVMSVEYRSHPIFSEGRVMGAVVTFSDITQRKEMQEQVWYQANYDALTDLPNRNLFHDRLDQAIAQAARTQGQLALLFVDLDGFKEVNDTLGHDAGDALLKETARRLTGCVRESDIVARMGGDEFTVILPRIDRREDAETVAAKIVQCLAQPFAVMEREVKMSGSVGIALYPNDGATGPTLLKSADAAMYRAKEAGRNAFRFYGA
jgi:diguanylate cyclase (GGDEF)-like protein/PAS domain S-box-containing protein